jgi:hypothetical protein
MEHTVRRSTVNNTKNTVSVQRGTRHSVLPPTDRALPQSGRTFTGVRPVRSPSSKATVALGVVYTDRKAVKHLQTHLSRTFQQHDSINYPTGARVKLGALAGISQPSRKSMFRFTHPSLTHNKECVRTPLAWLPATEPRQRLNRDAKARPSPGQRPDSRVLTDAGRHMTCPPPLRCSKRAVDAGTDGMAMSTPCFASRSGSAFLECVVQRSWAVMDGCPCKAANREICLSGWGWMVENFRGGAHHFVRRIGVSAFCISSCCRTVTSIITYV